MFGIQQHGEQDDMFYTVTVNGTVLEYFTTLTAASDAIQRMKEAVATEENDNE